MDEQPVLIEREGQLVGQRWTIDRDEYIIGRGGESALVLPERQVSRHHVKILNENGRYLLQQPFHLHRNTDYLHPWLMV